MQLRGSPVGREFKEKMNRKKERKRKLRLGLYRSLLACITKILFFPYYFGASLDVRETHRDRR
jgi:hypothetical protein